MKKFFKFFAVALVAGAMFTACGEDPILPEGGDTTTPGGDDPVVPENPDPEVADGVHVTFGNHSWDAAADLEASYLTLEDGSNVAYIFCSETAGGESFPMLNIAIDPNPAGEQTANIGIEGQYLVYDNPAFFILDYYKDSYIPNGQSVSGDWWGKSITWTVSAWDATAMNLNMNLDAVMYDAEAMQGNFEGAPTENLTVQIKNVKLTVPQQ